MPPCQGGQATSAASGKPPSSKHPRTASLSRHHNRSAATCSRTLQSQSHVVSFSISYTMALASATSKLAARARSKSSPLSLSSPSLAAFRSLNSASLCSSCSILSACWACAAARCRDCNSLTLAKAVASWSSRLPSPLPPVAAILAGSSCCSCCCCGCGCMSNPSSSSLIFAQDCEEDCKSESPSHCCQAAGPDDCQATAEALGNHLSPV
mmetsp:Transcript_17306/g.47659  ORF Transcript_17306/g.47659 Transcript_17306/m.47659 type:complete len:210 (+) Transcript_17306:91-720(+)